MRCLVMFITAVCLMFLLKLKWPKNKSVYDSRDSHHVCFHITVEPRYNEGPRDWQNMFVIGSYSVCALSRNNK